MTNVAELPFLADLEDLRKRLGLSLLAIFTTAIFCFIYASQLFDFLNAPLRQSFSSVLLIGTTPAEAFIIKIKVAIISGIVLSSPIWFFEIWRFVAPGLYQHERRFAFPFVAIATFFFLAGIFFCYYLVLPFALRFFFLEYQSIGVRPNIKISEYLSFAVMLLLVFGLVFEIPILSYFLARFRVLTHSFLMSNFSYATLLIFIAAGVLTPGPDVVSQLFLAAPMFILYGLSILICYLVEKKAQQAAPHGH